MHRTVVTAGPGSGSSAGEDTVGDELDVEVAAGRKAAPVNLTCFVLLGMVVCLVTWGLDRSLFELHEYKNVQDVYERLGVNVFDSSVYGQLGTEKRGLTGAAVVVLFAVTLIWCLSAYLYITRCRTGEPVAPLHRFALKASRSDADFLRYERHD